MFGSSFEISAFFLSLFSFVYCLTAKRKQYIPPRGFLNRLGSQHFQFLMMLAMNVLSSVASVVGVILLTLEGPGIDVWQYLFHAFYFVFHTTLSLAFGLYIIAVTGTNLKKYKVLHILFYAPYVVAEGLILTNQWSKWCFFIDETGYHRGPLMIVLYVLGAFYVVMGFFFFIKNMKAITRADSIAVGIFVIVASVGIIIQAVRADWAVELFAESLACLVIMMVLEEKTGHIDQSTGLYNRLAFDEAVQRKMAGKQPFDLAIVKIAGIANLVKHFDERALDILLLQFARYLIENREGGLIYCYRQGEFLAIFDKKEGDSDAFVRGLMHRLQSPWSILGADMKIDAILAVANVPGDIHNHDELEDLMAAYANYQKSKEGSYLIPNAELMTMVQSHLYEDELRKAIEEKKLATYFQPIYSLSQNRTISAEALLRIPYAPFHRISPELYIPIAEKTGLIREIGLFVFEEVCKYLAQGNKQISYIELNLSPYQFLDADLVKDFEAIRKKYGVASSKINLEVTETGGVLDKEEVLKILKQFRALGYTLSLDDFGTGYSNFIRVLRCKFENIKIDKSILWNIEKEENGLKTLRSLASFVKMQGACIVQEGVETKEQLAMAKACGCDYIQGFYFSEPLPKEKFDAYLARENH